MMRLFAGVLIVALWAVPATADSLNVGVINLKPWGFHDEDGKPAGQHIEMFEALSERVGITFEYSILPIPRIKNYLETGRADITVIFRREDMTKIVEFIELVMPYNYYLVGKKGVYFTEKSLPQARKVGFARGEEDVAKECFTDKYSSNARMIPASNYGNLLKMLNADRIDAATIPSKGLQAYLDVIGADQKSIDRLFVLCRNEAFLQISRKSEHFSPAVIKKLRDGIISMREDGTIGEIADKYQ